MTVWKVRPALRRVWPKRPQPGHVDVGVAGGADAYIQRRARLGNTITQYIVGTTNAGVKVFCQGLTRFQQLERCVQRVEQSSLGRCILVQCIGDAQGNPRRGNEIARRLVDLHDGAGAHEELGVHIATGKAA